MKNILSSLAALFILSMAGLLALNYRTDADSSTPSLVESPLQEYAGAERKAAKRARDAFFHRMLRDPKTRAIPADIRRRELEHAATLPKRGEGADKNGVMQLFRWHEAGPDDIGGRTRAVAVDRTNSNVVIAGGVSGGIWKSTDGGNSWTIKSDPSDPAGITYISQDPTNNNRWYATSGEFAGSNGDRGSRAFYYGPGIYRSTDNGESWELIELQQNRITFDSAFDYGIKVLVSPTTGTVFVASNGFGLARTENPGQDLSRNLTPSGFPMWTDFDIASNGNLIAVTSEFFDTATPPSPGDVPGVYHSTNDGLTWNSITPTGYPASSGRSVIAFAPSDPNTAYLWTYTGVTNSANNAFDEVEEMKFFAFNLGAGTSEDRTANLPDFGGQVGQLYSQNGYDMTIAVKPDDPDFVLLGGTNLFRSRDGFATQANDKNENWIGGYATQNNISQYNNHHSDQHILFFDRSNTNALWSGHDGGLSFLPDVTSSAASMPWQDKNDGFNVTQFYHVEISDDAGDDRILGGTQDNGSPFFRFDTGTTIGTSSNDVSTGDGGYAYLGSNYAIASTQNGDMSAFQYNASGNLLFLGGITPPGASNQLFVNPFAVDPTSEIIIYYPAGRNIWRRNPGTASSNNWTNLNNFTAPSAYTFTAVATGIRNNDVVLYAGASGSNEEPLLFRLDNATTSTEAPVELNLPDSTDAYVHSIAVNPTNGDEILVAMSNYNLIGLYHSSDAGATLNPVEGNLEGTAGNPGPSIRSVAILSLRNSTAYLVGTSTGFYSTETLNGMNTTWVQEADQSLGSAIVESISIRAIDGRVALGTHGRGVFVGTPIQPVSNEDEESIQPESYTLDQNYPNPFNPSTTLSFSLKEPSRITVTVFDVAGRRVRTLLEEAVKEPGDHSMAFNAGGLPSGTYMYQLKASPLSAPDKSFTTSKSMVLAK